MKKCLSLLQRCRALWQGCRALFQGYRAVLQGYTALLPGYTALLQRCRALLCTSFIQVAFAGKHGSFAFAKVRGFFAGMYRSVAEIYSSLAEI